MGLINEDHFDDATCLALLSRSNYGRVGLSIRALPVVIPVRYTVAGDMIHIHVTDLQVAAAISGNVAALQADGFDEDSGRRWTVLSVGQAVPVEDPERAELLRRPPFEQISSTAGALFRMPTTILSGRWVDTEP